jgi:D-alanyl-D-alanine dipeptidase
MSKGKKMKVATIEELQAIEGKDDGEALVNLKQIVPGIVCDYRRSGHFTMKSIWVRKSVATKLSHIQAKLVKHCPTMQLLVTEGYRHAFYQESYYLEEFLKLARKYPQLSPQECKELTHQFVALPSVAGHPTGGAIDLTIIDKGIEIDMGCAIADFTTPELLPTYSPRITLQQSEHRSLLHDLMVEAGFAPFYGEWWHFSYGDREWAQFYGHNKAHYLPLAATCDTN